MSWTDPRTWQVGEVVTKVIMDAHVKMNLRYLKGKDGTVTLEDGLNLGANELTINSLETVGVDGIVNKEQVEDHTHADGANCGTVAHSALTGLTAGDDHTQYQKESLLTTSGDTIYATGASAWARLGKGTTGQYLKQGASYPEWAASLFAGYKVVKVTVNYDDASPVTVLSAPAGSLVTATVFNITTTWAGDVVGGVDLGDAGDPDGFLAKATFNWAVADWHPDTIGEEGAYLYNAVTRRDFKLYATATDIIATISGTNLTQGVVDVYIIYVDLSAV